MGAQALIGGLIGLALIGWGVLVLVRDEAPSVNAAGRVWRSAFEAAVFWFLLGLAALVGPFVWIADAGGWMGPDAAFWILLTPVPLALLAITWFRPRKAPDLRRR